MKAAHVHRPSKARPAKAQRKAKRQAPVAKPVAYPPGYFMQVVRRPSAAHPHGWPAHFESR